MTPPTLSYIWCLFMQWLADAHWWRLTLGMVAALLLVLVWCAKRTRIVATIVGGLAVWGVFVVLARGVVELVVRDLNGGWMATLVLLVTAGLAIVTVVRVAYPPPELPKSPAAAAQKNGWWRPAR